MAGILDKIKAAAGVEQNEVQNGSVLRLFPCMCIHKLTWIIACKAAWGCVQRNMRMGQRR